MKDNIFQSSFESNNSAFEHASKQFKPITDYVSSLSQEQMTKLLFQVLDNDTVYTTLVPNGNGGVVAQWMTTSEYMFIEIQDNLSSLVCGDSNGICREISFNIEPFDILFIRNFLKDMTSKVMEVNPEWRENFSLF